MEIGSLEQLSQRLVDAIREYDRSYADSSEAMRNWLYLKMWNAMIEVDYLLDPESFE